MVTSDHLEELQTTLLSQNYVPFNYFILKDLIGFFVYITIFKGIVSK